MINLPKIAVSACLAWLFCIPASAQDHMHSENHSEHTITHPDKPQSDWDIHGHIRLDLIAIDQGGPRGGDKRFVAGMVMLSAERPLGERNDLKLNLMLSPDPFMGKRGYPLLLQSGETADGVTPLIDRQHPHDLFMNLSATLRHEFSDTLNGQVTIGWPSEIAFGPTPFMHRASGENLPTAPISHHWFDSGHIAMGVIGAGLQKGPLSLEVSRFTGREPDQRRFNLEPVRLDSTAIRLKWQLTDAVHIQGSYADLKSPEGLEPDINLKKTSLSVESEHQTAFGDINTTLAYGRKKADGGHHTSKPMEAWLAEANWAFSENWTITGRFERVHQDELAPPLTPWVAKAELGLSRRFNLNETSDLNLGLVRQWTDLPQNLKVSYGNNPSGWVGYIRFNRHFMKM
jgi:hypothetical protein